QTGQAPSRLPGVKGAGSPLAQKLSPLCLSQTNAQKSGGYFVKTIKFYGNVFSLLLFSEKYYIIKTMPYCFFKKYSAVWVNWGYSHKERIGF
ncbi:MAG: hypothetical protein ACI4J7_07025, partial [Ruminiclostridium sp.]